MHDALRGVLEHDPRLAYALVFGSEARGRAHRRSDVEYGTPRSVSAPFCRPRPTPSPPTGQRARWSR